MGAVPHFASARDFLDKMLPVERTELDQIYAKVTSSDPPLYANGCWDGIPSDGGSYRYDDLYEPFVNIGNRVAAIARDVVGEREDQVRHARWVDYQSNPPRSLRLSKKLSPCGLVMDFADTALDDPVLPPEQKESLWWMQFVVAVEAKRSSYQEDDDLVRKLLGSLCLIMTEQVDRRFAFGLYLSRTHAWMWLHDRSGVLGMDNPIHIHQSPKDFVQIIAALSILPAHRLGFDPTMKVAREPSPPIHIYRLSLRGPHQFDVETYKKTEYAVQWVISTEDDVFLTTKLLIARRNDGLSGSSGCTVWAVVRYVDRQEDPDKRAVYVLKQWWEPKGRVDEGAILEHLHRVNATSPDEDAQFIGEMEFHETVKIGGEVDSTDGLVRMGVHCTPTRSRTRSSVVSRPPRANEDDPWLARSPRVTEEEMLSAWYRNASVLPRRTRMRLVLKTFGCSVKYFATLQELITVFLHGVRGHRFAHAHGVIHRDISGTNLLILLPRHNKALQHQPQGAQGCLIDFGYAKMVKTVAEREIPFEATDGALPPELKPGFVSALSPKLSVWPEDVFQRGLHLAKVRGLEGFMALMVVANYMNAAWRYHHSEASPQSVDVCTPESFGWNIALLKPAEPVLRDSDASEPRAPRTCDPAYTSAMILNSDPIYVDRDGLPTLCPSAQYPDAIHDMESFFWLLLNISITSSGPGAERREELCDNHPDGDRVPEEVLDLCDVVYRLFEGPLETIAQNKKVLFEKPKEFESSVLCHVHPYFDPLKPLLRRWWQLLVLAYKFEGYEYYGIHGFVIRLLEETLRNLQVQDNGSPNDAQREPLARQKREDFVREATYDTKRVAISTSQTPMVVSHPADSAELSIETAASKHFRTPQKEKRDAPLSPSSEMPPVKRSKT
ncbi:hypothetical protein FKP32DRAFT_533927 [Trametes sanguinea]|nr:hypothetical protein FKP32DRAFT_533927 [Trametes sanguinea]